MACLLPDRSVVSHGAPGVNTVGARPRPRSLRASRGSTPYSQRMKRAELERKSVRIALAVGFLGTLGLWLYTNYAFTRRIETAQHDSAQMATRYITAQEALSTVRSQVLVSSVSVRDALLDPTAAALQNCREQLAVATHVIN